MPGRVYLLFGLHVGSEIELHGLVESHSARTDIEIRLGRFMHPEWRPGLDDDYVRPGPGVLLFPHETGWYRLSDAREITVEADPGADPTLVRTVLLGRAMGALLQWRGLLALHASAVAAPDGAIVFLGASGAGKSTTAAAFVNAGYPLLSDEVVAVDFRGDVPRVLPGYPTLRLWPDAIQMLGFEGESVIPSYPPKLLLDLSGRSAAHAMPIAALCSLEPSESGSVCDDAGAQDAVRSLLRNSYAPRLVGVTKTAALHLTQCSILAAGRVLRVAAERTSGNPTDVVRLIERARESGKRVHER